MQLLSCRNLSKNFADQDVLKNISLDIDDKEVVGLVGKNGAGKTTLVNILFGRTNYSSGKIIKYKNNLKIGYLFQSTFYTENKFNSLFCEKEYDEITDILKISSNLGLKDLKEWEGDRVNNLSGGEKTKLALAEIWINKPDLLILDEPSNHLDVKGVDWLIDKVATFSGAVIVISHDRYFLDQVVDRIIELENGSINEYPGNYSFYREEKKRNYQEQLHQYQVQKKKEKKLKSQIQQLDSWASKGHNQSRKKALETGNKFGGKEHNRVKAKKKDRQVKSKLNRLMKLKEDGFKKPDEEPDIFFNFKGAKKRGKRLIEAKKISKGYPDKPLFVDTSFFINHGDCIGLYGKNGCGKSTLLKIILGQEKLDEGELWVSPSLSLSYLSQDVMDLSEEKTILESIGAGKYYNEEERSLLINMGFAENFLDKKIKYLSLGERTRIKIAELILQKSDCLILDEPNNHLDIYSREQLEDTLQQYNGTIILVSHDRYFLEKITDCMLLFKDNKIKRIEKGFKEYKETQLRKKEESKINKKMLKNKMLIENRIASVLTEISKCSSEDPEYQKLDQEFKDLIKLKAQFS